MSALVFAAAALQLGGSFLEAKGRSEAAEAKAAALEMNAELQEMNAKIAQQDAEYDAERIASAVRRVSGQQRAHYASSGIAMTGSAQVVIEDTIVQGELDRLTRLRQGAIAELNGRIQAQISRKQAGSVRRGGRASAAASIISGVGGAASLATS